MHDRFRKQIILSASIIIGSLVVVGLVIYLLSVNLDAEVNKATFNKTALITETTALETLADLKNNAATAQTYQSAMSKILVSQDQLINFPAWLNQLSLLDQVSESFSWQGSQVPPAAAMPGYIGFGINAAGSLEALTNFFKDVEYRKPQYLVSLDGFDITRSGSGYGVSANGRVFFK